MTKKEFVNAFAEKGELKIKDSERLVNAFLETVENALLKGDGVRFIAKKVVKFKVGKPLADKVAGQKGAKKATKKK